MKSVTLLIPFLLLLESLSGQSLSLKEQGLLPSVLKESSGLLLSPNGFMWSHADNSTNPYLYQISRKGKLVRSLYIKHASQLDWEDIAKDDQGNFYIGDFGNNNNNRQDLKIYKIPNPDLIQGDTAIAEVISFHYEDQTAFPPPASGLHYDMEAMIWREGFLYLFTKNRTDPYDGFTRLYQLSDTGGSQTAIFLDSVNLGKGSKELWWVTAADMSPDGKMICLLSSDKLWLLSCFQGNDFFGGAITRLGLGFISQKEGIAFAGQDTLYVTDEEVFIIGGRLYRSLLGPYANGLVVNLGKDQVVQGDSLVLDAGMIGAHYLWNTGDTTQKITVSQDGSYSVQVSLNDCEASDTISVQFSTTPLEEDLTQSDTGLQVTVSPNPFGLSTHIQCVLPQAGDVILEIFDLSGKKVAHLPYRYLQAGPQRFKLSRQNVDFDPGNYVLIISSNGRKEEKMLIRY